MTNAQMTDADVLRKALEVMRERGMAKGQLVDESGRVCARGAIMVALGAEMVPGYYSKGWDALRARWRPDELFAQATRILHPDYEPSYDWGKDVGVIFNNAPSTTHADVEAVFEEAIRLAEDA